MTADRTYGFSKSDAEALVASIGTTETEIPQLFPGGGGGAIFIRFQLNAELTGTTVAATIFDRDGETIEASATLEDPEQIFTGLTEDTRGIGLRDAGRYFILNANCPVEPEPEPE